MADSTSPHTFISASLLVVVIVTEIPFKFFEPTGILIDFLCKRMRILSILGLFFNDLE
jgi:hypothetical protein